MTEINYQNLDKLKNQGCRIIGPQEGFQTDFLASPADIVVGGGHAGGGKTYGLLLESIRHVGVKGFGGIIFRRTTPQIFNQGALWDTSMSLFPYVGGVPKESKTLWEFYENDELISKIKFNHLEYESNILDHQGGQYPFIGFDELTHFTKKQFFYLLSRNRSDCGVKPYVRATCNPDPDSWVAEFLEWWIDQETGYPIKERIGVLRYFIQDGDNLVWGDSVQEVVDKCPHIFKLPQFKDVKKEDLVKSVTFIPGDVYQNKIFLKKNPQYLGNLLSLDEADQLRLLKGNWKVRQDGSSLFNFIAIGNIFSNFIDQDDFKCITCDAARFGKDLAVIKTWIGYRVVRIQILTKSKTTKITKCIEAERKRMKIPTSQVLVDQDGVGGGVVDEGEYIGFSSNKPALPPPEGKERENYANLKTQCYYRFAEKVNLNQVKIELDNIFVDGVQTNEIKIGKKIYDVKKLIIEDLRSIKKKNEDRDGKRQINSKEEQKNILGGRSPDFGDTLMMRIYFELVDNSLEFGFA